MPLALLWDVTPTHTGLSPLGNPFIKRTIFTIQGTHKTYLPYSAATTYEEIAKRYTQLEEKQTIKYHIEVRNFIMKMAEAVDQAGINQRVFTLPREISFLFFRNEKSAEVIVVNRKIGEGLNVNGL